MYYLVFNCWLVWLIFLGNDGCGPWPGIGLPYSCLVPTSTILFKIIEYYIISMCPNTHTRDYSNPQYHLNMIIWIKSYILKTNEVLFTCIVVHCHYPQPIVMKHFDTLKMVKRCSKSVVEWCQDALARQLMAFLVLES